MIAALSPADLARNRQPVSSIDTTGWAPVLPILASAGINTNCLAYMQEVNLARETQCSTYVKDTRPWYLCEASVENSMVASGFPVVIPSSGPAMCGEGDRVALANLNIDRLAALGNRYTISYTGRVIDQVSEQCGRCFQARADLHLCASMCSGGGTACHICEDLGRLISTAHCLIEPQQAPPASLTSITNRGEVVDGRISTGVAAAVSRHSRPESRTEPVVRPVVEKVAKPAAVKRADAVTAPTAHDTASPVASEPPPPKEEGDASTPSGVFSAGRAIAPLVLAVLALVIFS